ncbi:hypothetical protein [Anderseniella sp. Alg231-50]|uniref:hypothetical protein n=1 Tax=Anderseniella sp. Alg231-50 TaxID=1922226 RepID=UPI000D55E09F
MFGIARNTLITLIAIVAVYWLISFYSTALRDPRFLDGWILSAAMLVQVLFHVRKKFPASPLGRAASWLKMHVYLGYLVVAVFLFHTSFSFPETTLEWCLWVLFVLVVGSGLVGLYLTNSIPGKLQQQHGEQITFEQIPTARLNLFREVNALVLDTVTPEGSSEVSDFYVNRLRNYFRRPQNLRAHLRGSRRPLERISSEIADLERRANAPDRKTLSSIRELVTAKYDLDHQYTVQGLLHSWLFVHIPATYSLIVLSILHVAVAYAYSSGVQ